MSPALKEMDAMCATARRLLAEPAPAPTRTEEEERNRFEDWARGAYLDLRRYPTQRAEYQNTWTDMAWRAWRAAVAITENRA